MDERGCELDILPKQTLSRKRKKLESVDEREAAFRGQLRRRAVQTSTSDSRLPTSRVHSEFTPHTLPFPLPVSYDFFYILKKKSSFFINYSHHPIKNNSQEGYFLLYK